ncbi:MAG: neutral/alkaline non-lysosomal ceramidase N-terminal domain-containing protein, partial [Elusimicrobia bacterium]|nr:neutral/alkaline non-lysosomal ceramidase N-terminal domain-containing protein [Elusimicrobiota bacterium]
MSGATGLSLLFGINFAAFAEFYAAAGKVEITPDPSQSAVWLAGYGAQGRRAQGVRDPLYARAVLISNGERTVGLVSVDLIGVFYSLTQSLRERLRVKDHREYLALAATHNHSGPDTLGLWGPRPGRSGVQARYLELLEKRIAKLLMDLAVRLEEVTLYAGRRQVMPQGLALDSRDPVIFDPELTVLRLRSRQTGKTVAILGNWACHP